jgi:uncharacterized protein YeeX (DUF496 family)
VPKCIVKTPWYIQNGDLHHDLRIEMVTDIIAKFANSHGKRKDHINIKSSRLLDVNRPSDRQLKCMKPFELVRL